jgi:hypothetical protein
MSTAAPWRDQRKVQQARELLAPVYGWFTEGHNTRDLKEAKALLEELGADARLRLRSRWSEGMLKEQATQWTASGFLAGISR